MKKRLLVIGGHGSGEIAMSVFQAMNEVTNEWEIEGFLNDIIQPGKYLGRYKVIGSSEEIVDYVNKGYFIHYTYHLNAKHKLERVKTFESLNIPLEANATGIHPNASMDNSTEIGYGCLICSQAATSFGPKLGNFIHIYTNGFIGHDTWIGDYSTITAHSVIGARVRINTGAHIGLNASIREDIKIGKYSIVGMGSVVVRNVDDFSIVVGNPAKKIK